MSVNLPYMNAYGKLGEVLEAIQQASTPDKFSQEYVKTKLGFKSSSMRPIQGLLVKLGFLTSDYRPTEAYNSFRTNTHSKAAMAQAIKNAYSDLYEVNEYAHDLDKEELKDKIIQLTGMERGSGTVNAIAGTFEKLKEYADFEAPTSRGETHEQTSSFEEVPVPRSQSYVNGQADENTKSFNLGYNIHLNLPESKDPEVFDAIFQSLRKNLLS